MRPARRLRSSPPAAADIATDEDRLRLQEIGSALREAVAQGDLDGYSALNRHLHDVVARAADQQVARSLPQHLALIRRRRRP